MTTKPNFKKASKKQLRKLVIQLTELHNTYEKEWLDREKRLIQTIKSLDEDIISLENTAEIRTTHTSELLRSAYTNT